MLIFFISAEPFQKVKLILTRISRFWIFFANKIEKADVSCTNEGFFLAAHLF